MKLETSSLAECWGVPSIYSSLLYTVQPVTIATGFAYSQCVVIGRGSKRLRSGLTFGQSGDFTSRADLLIIINL